MEKKKIPSPPIEIFGCTYYTLLDPNSNELETDMKKANRILESIEKTTEIPISKIFHIFERKTGLKSDFIQLVDIFKTHSPEVVKLGFEEMIQTCETNLAYKEKIKSYFLNSLKRFVINRAAKEIEKKQLEKITTKYSIIPQEIESDPEYIKFINTIFSTNEDIQIFSKIYQCKCGRKITLEVDRCPGCNTQLDWQKIPLNQPILKKKRIEITKNWNIYSKKFKTKNYGDWPNSVYEKIICTKCDNGTVIKLDENGEEYTDYCECTTKNNVREDFKTKLVKSNIPKDFWYLTTNSYTNPSDINYERLHNELSIQVIKRYIDNIDTHLENGRSLYLFGDNNTGKTMFMCIAMKEAIKKGYTVVFKTMSEIVNGYMQNWFEKKDISYFKECDLLGVDDSFDRRKTYTSENRMQISQIDDLFRYRIHNWKSTIITANIAIDDLNNADSILNLNLVRLLNRKMLPLTFRGDYTLNLQNRLRGEIIG